MTRLICLFLDLQSKVTVTLSYFRLKSILPYILSSLIQLIFYTSFEISSYFPLHAGRLNSDPKRVKSNYWANTNYIEKSNKQRISNLLQNETDHKKNGLLVTGALGSGKTAFLTELCYPGCGGNFSRKILNEKIRPKSTWPLFNLVYNK